MMQAKCPAQSGVLQNHMLTCVLQTSCPCSSYIMKLLLHNETAVAQHCQPTTSNVKTGGTHLVGVANDNAAHWGALQALCSQ